MRVIKAIVSKNTNSENAQLAAESQRLLQVEFESLVDSARWLPAVEIAAVNGGYIGAVAILGIRDGKPASDLEAFQATSSGETVEAVEAELRSMFPKLQETVAK